MWQSADDGVRRNWQDSLAYAESASLAGYSDWRMPNIKELQSIVEYGGEVGAWPAIDTRFFTLSGDNTINDPSWVWSSTTQGDFKFSATYISFSKAFSKKTHLQLSTLIGMAPVLKEAIRNQANRQTTT